MEDGPFGAMPNVRALRIFRCDEPRKFVLAHGAEREGRALVGEKNMCARERMRANTLTRMELEVFSMVKLKNTHWEMNQKVSLTFVIFGLGYNWDHLRSLMALRMFRLNIGYIYKKNVKKNMPLP